MLRADASNFTTDVVLLSQRTGATYLTDYLNLWAGSDARVVVMKIRLYGVGSTQVVDAV